MTQRMDPGDGEWEFLRFFLSSRASARPTLPYPMMASFNVRLYPACPRLRAAATSDMQ